LATAGIASDDVSLTAVVAAMEEEVVELRARMCGAVTRVSVTGARVAIGWLGTARVALAVTGDGERNARRGLAALLAGQPVSRIIVVGVAGGLDASLGVGALVIGERVIEESNGSVRGADARLVDVAAKACGARRAVVLSAGRIADTADEKRRLYAVATSQAAAGDRPSDVSAVVDLESAAFAAVAMRMGVPWMVLRAVSDTAGEAVPALLNRSRDDGGAVRRSSVLRALLANPRALRPLLALRERVLTCAGVLANAVELTVAALREMDGTAATLAGGMPDSKHETRPGRSQMEPEVSPFVGGSGNQPHGLQPLLHKTSRTFALSIPLLPEPLRTQVATAYLLFRIIDTFEDATRWDAARRVKELALVVRLMESDDAHRLDQMTAQWLVDPPVDNPAYLELLAAAPEVMGWCRLLAPAAREQLRRHLVRSARGMMEIVVRTDAQGSLRLRTMQELRGYCFVVAGIVGEMLTELFILQSPSLNEVAGDLRARAIEFGEALQLVNILKDARSDEVEGRVYLPSQAGMSEVLSLARADLRRATEYTELLRTAKGDRGIVAFNALNLRLAIATLHLVRDQGPGAKLTRLQVMSLAAQVMNTVETAGILFPETP
jgi:farnesyl-diphosphate farnesyltransferase